jgi:hypothetical protein
MRLYHLTRSSRLGSIMSEGLRPGPRPGPRLFGCGGGVRLLEKIAYGAQRPVYLSLVPFVSPDRYRLAPQFRRPGDFVLLSVEVDGLELLADVPMIHDTLLCYRDRRDLVVVEHGSPLDPYLTKGRISLSSLGQMPLTRDVMSLTDTCATLDSIDYERLQVVAG